MTCPARRSISSCDGPRPTARPSAPDIPTPGTCSIRSTPTRRERRRPRRNAGTNFTFDANGQMNPAVTNLTLPNVVVDGVSLGSLNMAFGAGGITQFSDPNGGAEVNQLDQNGFAAGSVAVRQSVNEKGRLVGLIFQRTQSRSGGNHACDILGRKLSEASRWWRF